MKILLVWPNFYSLRLMNRKGLALSLASLAAVIEESGHNIKIIDPLIMRYDFTKLIKKIKDYDPDVLGLTVTTELVYKAYKIVESYKKINPNCLTILGGPHPTVCSKEILQECKYVDIVVRGEGEITIIELLDNFEKQKSFKNVKGITYRENGKILENPDRELISNLDSLPTPAFHLLPIKRYTNEISVPEFGIKGNLGLISSTRGCPYNCVFCASNAIWYKTCRSRSPEKVIEDIKILREKFGFKIIEFVDDTFISKNNNAEEICRLIKKEDLDICWSCMSRVELINKELVKLFKKTKCFEIAFGFESGVQQSLDFLCKGIKIEHSVRASEIVKNEGIRTFGSFIIGVPGETKEMIHQTIKFAKSLNSNKTVFGILIPLPGTMIYDYSIKNNLLLTKDWSKYVFSRPLIKLQNISPFELKGLFYYANLSGILKNKA